MAKIREMTSKDGDKVLMDYDASSIAQAEALFNERVFGSPTLPEEPRARMLAFVNRGNGDQTPIKRFDPEAEDIVLMPPIVGG
jgi:hypothetical protein